MAALGFFMPCGTPAALTAGFAGAVEFATTCVVGCGPITVAPGEGTGFGGAVFLALGFHRVFLRTALLLAGFAAALCAVVGGAVVVRPATGAWDGIGGLIGVTTWMMAGG